MKIKAVLFDLGGVYFEDGTDKFLKILSNLSDNVPERVDFLQKKYHFLDLFDDVVLSCEVNLKKTSDEIFNLALSRINVKPEEAIFVDDREVNLKVASELGIKSILYTSIENLQKELELHSLKDSHMV